MLVLSIYQIYRLYPVYPILTHNTMQGLPTIHLTDVVDILLVAFLFYQIYKLMRGTNVIRIFWAIVVIYLGWLVTSRFRMRFTSEILGQFVNIGFLALIIVFQPEIRHFLLLVGTKTQIGGNSFWKRLFFWRSDIGKSALNIEPYIQACMHMSQQKVGALIIFVRKNAVDEVVATGERIEAKASSALIETLFFKNSPLHDGAVIVRGNEIVAARCILPVSSSNDIDPSLGLRHRSAIGMTEQNDSIAVVVSEETGAISYAESGVIHHAVTPLELRQFLNSSLATDRKNG